MPYLAFPVSILINCVVGCFVRSTLLPSSGCVVNISCVECVLKLNVRVVAGFVLGTWLLTRVCEVDGSFIEAKRIRIPQPVKK